MRTEPLPVEKKINGRIEGRFGREINILLGEDGIFIVEKVNVDFFF